MLKPQDILILMKLTGTARSEWTFASLADDLAMSASEVHQGIRRAAHAGLYDERRGRVRPAPLLQFLVHGLRYAFAAEVGDQPRLGIPTAHSAAPLSSEFVYDEHDQFVWPHPEGTTLGAPVKPLYPSVPAAVARDRKLHERLALLDAIRVGRTRERDAAIGLLASDLGVQQTSAKAQLVPVHQRNSDRARALDELANLSQEFGGYREFDGE